jgi:hypothetical protein
VGWAGVDSKIDLGDGGLERMPDVLRGAGCMLFGEIRELSYRCTGIIRYLKLQKYGINAGLYYLA